MGVSDAADAFLDELLLAGLDQLPLRVHIPAMAVGGTGEVETVLVNGLGNVGRGVESAPHPGRAAVGQEVGPPGQVHPAVAIAALVGQGDVDGAEHATAISLGARKAVPELPEERDGALAGRLHPHAIVVAAGKTTRQRRNVVEVIRYERGPGLGPRAVAERRGPDRSPAEAAQAGAELHGHLSLTSARVIHTGNHVGAPPGGGGGVELPVEAVR